MRFRLKALLICLVLSAVLLSYNAGWQGGTHAGKSVKDIKDENLIFQADFFPLDPVDGQVIYRIDLEALFLHRDEQWPRIWDSEAFGKIYNSLGHTWEPTGPNIQAAIDDLGGERGTVWLPKGDFYTDGLTINRGTLRIQGAGIDVTRIFLNDNINDHMIKIEPSTDVYFLELSHMELRGNKENNTAGDIIHISSVNGGSLSDLRMNHIYAIQAADNCLYTDRSWGYMITNCIFEFARGDGLFFDWGCSHAVLMGCKSLWNEGKGIRLAGSSIKVIACDFGDNYEDGINVLGSNHQIIGGHLFRNSRAGVGLHNGILLEGSARRTKILSVDIDGKIDGTNYHNYGIRLYGGGEDCYIDDCFITNSVVQDIWDAGTRTRINGVGREACGGESPTAANWNFGDIVQDTDTPANHWIKDYDGTMRQI